MTDPTILDTIGHYYGDRIRQHGATPAGVDWNGEAGQALRFEQLLRVTEGADTFTLGEVGCGYGALVDVLAADARTTRFVGIDLAPDMIAAADERYGALGWTEFKVADHVPEPVDFVVASGIFNVRLDTADGPWLTHIYATLDAMDKAAMRGFAFNALTSYSDADKMRDYLYYCDPLALFDRAKRHYAKNVALLHDYGLYEFTLIVRKDVG